MERRIQLCAERFGYHPGRAREAHLQPCGVVNESAAWLPAGVAGEEVDVRPTLGPCRGKEHEVKGAARLSRDTHPRLAMRVGSVRRPTEHSTNYRLHSSCDLQPVGMSLQEERTHAKPCLP